MYDRRGTLHRHQDGTVHRHFSTGLTIGRQVIPEEDGSNPHEHGKLAIGQADDPRDMSGPVVEWPDNG